MKPPELNYTTFLPFEIRYEQGKSTLVEIDGHDGECSQPTEETLREIIAVATSQLQ